MPPEDRRAPPPGRRHLPCWRRVFCLVRWRSIGRGGCRFRHDRAPLPIILALGTTQTLAWASSYYLPAILADPIARDLGVSSNWIFAAFSASLVISALLGPRIGRQIDLVGGRPVLSMSNLTIAAGLALLGFTYSIPVLIVAWLLLGIGMGCRPL